MKHFFSCFFLLCVNTSILNAQYTWINRETGSGNMLTASAFGNGVFVVGGEEGILLSSADGVTWKQEESPVTSLINAISFRNGRFIAVTSDGHILSSQKGNNWSVDYTDEYGKPLRAVSFCGNMFIAVGNNTIVTSLNGIQWQQAELAEVPEVDLYAVTYGNGLTILAGSNGMLLYSKNNQEWKKAEADSASGFVAAAFGKHKFVAVTEDGRAFSSSDGMHWMGKNMLNRYPLTCSNLVFVNNIFIAIGSPGLMAISTDGKIWEELLPDTSGDLLSTCYGNNSFMVSGSMGLIMTSQRSAQK